MSSGVPPPGVTALNASGGGLRDVERRASPCKKGIGENSGVLGTEEDPVPNAVEAIASGPAACGDKGGNESQVEVT